MSRILAIANQKGGVGKTTTVLNLGAALTELGYRVLLVDLDASGSMSIAFGFDPHTIRRSTYTLLMYENVSLARVMTHIGGAMGLIPASIDLATAEVTLGADGQAVFRLRQALARSRIHFDFVLIDTPPNLGIMTANALVAATGLIIPVQCQYLAMHGVRDLLETVYRVQQTLNPNLKLLGVLGTMYRRDSRHSQEVIQEIRYVFPQETFHTVIGDSEMVAEAPVAKQSVLQYAPADPSALAYRALAQEIVHERNTK